MVEIIISENKLALDKLNKLKFSKYKVKKSKFDKDGDIKIFLQSGFRIIRYYLIKEGQNYILYTNKIDKNYILFAKGFEKIFECEVKIMVNQMTNVKKYSYIDCITGYYDY